MITALVRVEQAARALRPALLAAGLLLGAGAVWACPICFSGRVPLLGPRIDAADAVVLATPLGEAGPYRVIASIKGAVPEGTMILEALPASSKVVQGQPALAVRNRSSQQWSALGTTSVAQADWLRAFAAGGPASGSSAAKAWPRTLDTTADLADEDWTARLALVAPALESSDRLVAEIAYGEIARAPYRLLRSLKGMREPADVVAWLDNPELAPRKPAYTLLLGVIGGEAERRVIEAQIEEQRASRRVDNLAALMTADLELGGSNRLGALSQAYLTDTTRSLPEIEAALLALSVQGATDAAVPRARIVSVYGDFVRAHPAMAGFVVQDLSDWATFAVAGELEAAVTSGAVRDPASRSAVLAYLRRDPAHAAVASHGAGGDLPP